MSDRPHGSVRTGSRGGDAPAAGEVQTDGAPAGSTGGKATAAGGKDAGAAAPQGAVRPATGAQAAPAAASGPAPAAPAESATGTQSIPATGTQSIPTTGAQAVPTTGTQSIPTTGAQRATVPPTPPVGAQSAPTGTRPAADGGAAATGVPAAGAPAAAGKGRAGRSSGRGPRRARLQLRHIDTWSALKISLVLSIALFFIWMVAVGVLYGVLNSLGVFETLNELFGQLSTDSGSDEGSEVLTPGVVFGGAAIIGAINIVLLTALCTVGTFIYNMCSDLVGGLEVTLSERD